MASIHRLPVSQMPTAHAEKKRAQDRINQRYSRARRKSKVEELEVKNKALLQRLVQAEAEIARLRDSQAVAAQRPLLMEKADPHAPQHYLQDTSEHLASKPSNAPRVETSRSGTGGLENESNLPTALTLRSEAVFALVEPNSLESELLRLHASSCAASQAPPTMQTLVRDKVQDRNLQQEGQAGGPGLSISSLLNPHVEEKRPSQA